MWVWIPLLQLNFSYRTCFEQGVPWHSGNYRVYIHSENAYVTWEEHTVTIILVENDKIFQDDKAITNAFINYFTNVTHSVGLKKKNIGLEKLFSKIVENFQKFWEFKED